MSQRDIKGDVDLVNLQVTCIRLGKPDLKSHLLFHPNTNMYIANSPDCGGW